MIAHCSPLLVATLEFPKSPACHRTSTATVALYAILVLCTRSRDPCTAAPLPSSWRVPAFTPAERSQLVQRTIKVRAQRFQGACLISPPSCCSRYLEKAPRVSAPIGRSDSSSVNRLTRAATLTSIWMPTSPSKKKTINFFSTTFNERLTPSVDPHAVATSADSTCRTQVGLANRHRVSQRARQPAAQGFEVRAHPVRSAHQARLEACVHSMRSQARRERRSPRWVDANTSDHREDTEATQ